MLIIKVVKDRAMRPSLLHVRPMSGAREGRMWCKERKCGPHHSGRVDRASQAFTRKVGGGRVQVVFRNTHVL